MPEVLGDFGAADGEGHHRLLGLLDGGERDVLRVRFGLTGGEPRTVGYIAATLGLTAEATRRLQARGLAKLRHPSSGQDLTDLLAS